MIFAYLTVASLVASAPHNILSSKVAVGNLGGVPTLKSQLVVDKNHDGVADSVKTTSRVGGGAVTSYARDLNYDGIFDTHTTKVSVNGQTLSRVTTPLAGLYGGSGFFGIGNVIGNGIGNGNGNGIGNGNGNVAYGAYGNFAQNNRQNALNGGSVANNRYY
jgi:hypothetical protein